MRSLWPAFICLFLVLSLGETTGIDLWVQDHFFDFATRTWWVDKEAPWPRLIFYVGAKYLFGVLGVLLLIGWLFSRDKPWRPRLALMLLALIVVPLVLSGAKNFTNVHCPWSLERYGGGCRWCRFFPRIPSISSRSALENVSPPVIHPVDSPS
ncbi:MAG: hypothetical protein HQM02_02875 [Magnetococcales bacterium]|nr:hypothetical protein [Magnetococcales bacterium]